MAAADASWSGGVKYDTSEATGQICPEYFVLANNERIPAIWHTFVPETATKPAHWLCQICAGKKGCKKQVDLNHLASAEHQTKIGKGPEYEDKTNVANAEAQLSNQKGKKVKIFEVVAHHTYGGPPSPDDDADRVRGGLMLRAPSAVAAAAGAAAAAAPAGAPPDQSSAPGATRGAAPQVGGAAAHGERLETEMIGMRAIVAEVSKLQIRQVATMETVLEMAGQQQSLQWEFSKKLNHLGDKLDTLGDLNDKLDFVMEKLGSDGGGRAAASVHVSGCMVTASAASNGGGQAGSSVETPPAGEAAPAAGDVGGAAADVRSSDAAEEGQEAAENAGAAGDGGWEDQDPTWTQNNQGWWSKKWS